MERTITAAVSQCPLTVSAIGFTKLFRSALPLVKKYIAPVTLGFETSAIHNRGPEKDFKRKYFTKS